MGDVIEVQEPERPPRRVTITAPTEIGRLVEGIRVEDPSASRRHAVLYPTPEGLAVSDLGSTTGTTLNGSTLSAPAYLHIGDRVVIGRTTLVVLDPDGPAGSAADEVTDPPDPAGASTTGPVGGSTATATAPLPGPADAPAAPAPAPSVPAPTAPATTGPEPTAGTGAGGPPAGDDLGTAPPGAVPPAPAARPLVEQLQALAVEGVATIRYRPGSAGERAAKGVAGAARRARKRLQGLGSEPWGVLPQICLVDPFPDPARPGLIVTEGTVVDAERNEIWMVVTAEAPPEALERPLALLFGASLPAAADLELLLEGYGLWLAKTPSPDPQLQGLELPPLLQAEGELRGAMALSFVAFLIDREKEEGLRRLLGTATTGRLEVAVQEVYGLDTNSLEAAWRDHVQSGGPKVRPRQFLKLSLQYLKPHKFKQAEIFVYMLFALGFNMVFPFATRALFDTALPSGEFSQVLRLLVGLAVVFVISMLAGLRQTYLSAWISGAVVRDVRGGMYDKLQDLPAAWYKRHQQGDVLTRLFSDVMVVEQGLTSTLRDGLFQMLSLVVSGIVMLTISPLLGVIVLVGAPLVAIVYRVMGKGAQKRGLALQEDTGALMGVAAENYAAEPVVKTFSLQNRERERFGRLSARLFRSERRLTLFGGIFGLSVNMIVTVLRLLVLGLGSWFILQGSFTIGGLVAFLGIMGEVLSPVTVLTGIGQQIQAATGGLHRIDEVMAETTETDGQAGLPDLAPLQREITFDHVDFSYTAERQVLTDVSVVIPAGSRVAFVGPSGSGKSTCLQLLMRLYDPDDGAVRFDGVDTRTVTIESLRRTLGVVFQESFLFDTTIRENIALGHLGATEAEIVAAAQAAEVHEFIESMPRGYDTLVGERGGMLSGGQRQRLAIARALVRNPTVLLLDEATSALDPRTERQITATLNRIAAGRTTIAITHRLTSVTDYDLLYVIAEGQIVEQGTHEELVAAGGTYARLWSEQTGAPVELAGPAPFDAVGALARVPIFEGLDPAALADVAARLQSVDLAPGQSLPDGAGRLALLVRGRARVLAPALGGGWATAAELATGDAFGVSALLGGAGGTHLEALEATTLAVLDDGAIAGLAATHPSVAAALEGAARGLAAPEGGTRLSRMTVSVRADELQQLVGSTPRGTR